ncbi:allene oxide synthase-lipoxygenase protein-like [Ptychodera flava]|uniref:allene oxide synthase-lipoxygenase protein-like n=1 Tax=Ptychodera flava TaxID=63121 RepID=UPI00396A8CE7
MGNFISLPDYNIYVRTGDLRGSGTDANVYVVLHSESGEKSEVIRLANLWRNNFERGRTDIFAVRNLPNFGPIAKLEIWRDALFGDEWYVDYVEVEDGTQENRYPFPIQRWVTVQHLIIYKYDSVLPQFAPNPEERKTELDEKRSVYKSVTQVEGLPPFVTTVPRNEAFTVTYRYEIDKTKFQLSITALVKMFKGLVSSKEWKSFDDVNSLYGGFLEEPMHVDSWKEEWYFAEQRLRGSNPVQIRLCTEIPDNLGVTDDMMQPLLEGLTISDAIAEKRLFIVNYTILKDVPTTSKNVTLCAPIALFFLNKDKDLTTVAIQLFQDKAEDNPVFLPTDPPNTWLLAKMYFNVADASVHEANTHLLCTHLAMECFAMSTHRHLSPSHPMYRLMIPHFQYMLPMNHKGYPTLMDPGGWFDKVMTMGRVGAEELMRRQWKE